MSGKTLFALLAIGSLAGSALAQSSVRISGYADASVLWETGSPTGSVKKLSSGLSGPTRLVFSGRQDLGDGMAASFHVENGFLVDTGGSNQPFFWGRQAYLGLSTPYGNLRAGNMFHSTFANVVLVADPCGNAYACAVSNLMTAGAGAGPNANGVIGIGPGQTSGATLVNPTNGGANGSNAGSNRANMLAYTSPKLGGLEIDLQYAFGERAEGMDRSRTLGVGARYRSEGLSLVANLLDTNDINGDPDRSALLAVVVNFKPLALHVALGDNRYSGRLGAAKRSRDMMIGMSLPWGNQKVVATYVRKDDRLAANRDASQVGAAYIYSLSERTQLHATVGRLSNKNGATYGLGTPAGAASPNPFNGKHSQVGGAGIGYSF